METRELPLVAVPEAGERTPDRDTCPTTMAQLSLWFVDKLVPDSSIYAMPRVFRVVGPLDREALAGALTAVVARHEALRTTFVEVAGRAHQVINPARSVVPTVLDASAVPEHKRFAEAVRLAGVETERPFDLAAGPLFRVCLIVLGPEDHLLVLTVHHIVCDGWSLVVLARELSTAYAELVAGRDAGLPPLALQLGDYATWEAEQSVTESFAERVAYWRERLTDAPSRIALPSDRPRTRTPDYTAGTVTSAVDTTVLAALRELAADERTTLFMVTLTTFLALLDRYVPDHDVVVGVPVAGRRPEFADVIGYFANTLAIRTDLSGSPTFRELLGRVREICLDAFSHQDVPLATVVEELNPVRDVTRTPVVQVLFQHFAGFGERVPEGGDEPTLAGTTVSTVDLPNRSTEWELEVQAVESGGGLEVLWIYRTDLFDHSTVDAMSRQFAALLAAFAAGPDTHAADVDLLAPHEDERIAERERAGAQLRVVDRSLRRCPVGVPGELVVAGGSTATAVVEHPSLAATRLVPDPFADKPGTRMLATGSRARYRRDGTIEILGPVATSCVEPVPASATGAAADEVSEQVAAVLAELLGVAEIGPDDNFFDLGGHSILAIRAIIALSEKFGLELPLRVIFDAPTVAAMSDLIRSGDVAAGVTP